MSGPLTPPDQTIGIVTITPSDAEVLKSWYAILNLGSLVLSAVAVLINVSVARKRLFPCRLSTCFAICCIGFHGTLIYGYVVDYDMLVLPGTQPSAWSGCAVQALFFQFFALSLVCWWACMCGNLYLLVCKSFSMRAAMQLEPKYHLLSWGLPALTTIIVLAFQLYGTEVGALYCWLSTSHYSLYKMLLFYVFMATLNVIGGAWCWLIMRSLYRHKVRFHFSRAAVKRIEQDGSTGVEEGAYFNYFIARQILFMLVFCLRFFVFLAWEVNYILFQAKVANIGMIIAFIVNYFVGTIGLDCFILIALTLDNVRAIVRKLPVLSKLLRTQSYSLIDEDDPPTSRGYGTNSTTSPTKV